MSPIRAKYEESFELAGDFYRFCKQQLVTTQFPKNDGQKVTVVLLYSRIIEGLEAVILLLENGLRSPTEVVIRSMLSSVFRLEAIARDADRVADYQRDGDVLTLRMIRRALQKGHFDNLPQQKQITGQRIKELERQLGGRRDAATDEQWAGWAKLDKIYDLVYPVHSLTSHSNIRTLERHVDANGGFVVGPDDRSVEESLIAACQATLISAKAVFDLFGSQTSEQYESLKIRWTRIADRIAAAL